MVPCALDQKFFLECGWCVEIEISSKRKLWSNQCIGDALSNVFGNLGYIGLVMACIMGLKRLKRSEMKIDQDEAVFFLFFEKWCEESRWTLLSVKSNGIQLQSD